MDSFGFINQDEHKDKLALFPPHYFYEFNIGVNIMFVPIPSFPNYEFNLETLALKRLSYKRRHPSGSTYLTKERIIKGSKSWNGYYLYSLSKEGKSYMFPRSRLCWFVNTGSLPQKGFVIDHIDEDKTNDHFSNLQILGSGDNLRKSFL